MLFTHYRLQCECSARKPIRRVLSPTPGGRFRHLHADDLPVPDQARGELSRAAAFARLSTAGSASNFSLACTAAQDRDRCAHAMSLVRRQTHNSMETLNSGPLGYGGGSGGAWVGGPVIAAAAELNT